MPTLLPPEHPAQDLEPLSHGRPLAEENPLDPDALHALREFFLIVDVWDRAEAQKLSTGVRSPVDNPPHQAQGDRNMRAHQTLARRGK
jgi:hypothetical protein